MSDAVAARVMRYLGRRIGWLERMASDLAAAEEHLEGPGLELALDRQARLMREGEQLDREHDVLLREWQAADAPEEARRAVRELADAADALRRKVQTLAFSLAAAADAAGDRQTDERRTAKRGRAMLRGYRPGGEEGFFERKA